MIFDKTTAGKDSSGSEVFFPEPAEDTSDRDEKQLPRFMRNGNATATPGSSDVSDYTDEKGTHLPRFMRSGAGPDGYAGAYESDGTPAEFSPAIQQHEPPNDKSETQQPEVKAKRARNKAENAESDVIATTSHGAKVKKPWKRGKE